MTASVGSISGTTTVIFSGSGVSTISVSADPTSIVANGISTSTITAIAKTGTGEGVSDIEVSFVADNGSITASGITDGEGKATATLTSSTQQGVATVTASVGSISGATTVTFSDSGAPTASMTLIADPTSIPADGESSSAITATLKDGSGGPVAKGTSVTFSTTLGTFPGGITSYATTTPDDSGSVTVSLIAGITPGIAVITAESNSVTQKVSVEFTEAGGGEPGPPASIEVSSVQRDPISIKGSGQPETSRITFIVKDESGLEVEDGHTINFSIEGGGLGGGELLTNSAANTEGGYAGTTLQSGTKAGTVKIKAEWADDPSVETNVTITIAGGPPYGEHMGVTPERLNIAGLVEHGLEDRVTMRTSDKYYNEVPDGTSVYFTTNYGMVKAGEEEVPTTDSAATTTLISQVPDPPGGFVTPAASTQSGAYAQVLCMEINQDNGIIYLGTDGGGVFKTTNSGAKWYQKGVPDRYFTNGMVWDIKIDLDNPAIIYAATNDGIFRSTGSGDNWEKISGDRDVTGEYLGILDTTDADHDGYSREYTLTYSSNGIRSKTQVYLDGVETYQYVYTSPTTIKFIVKNLGLGGEVIAVDYTTVAMLPPFYPVRALALGPLTGPDPVTDRTLYTGIYGKGVYKSQDAGFSWTPKNLGLADPDVLSLAIDPTDSTIIYAGTEGGGVFKTTDAAETWAPSNTGLPASVIHAITIDPGTPANLYVGAEENGVYYSTDGGTKWTAPAINVTSTRVTRIVLDGTTIPAAEIYAATYGDDKDPPGGVYKSSDSGDTWTRLTALDENHVRALGIIPGPTDTLFAGTWGRNFFKSTDAGATWIKKNGVPPNELTNQIFTTSRVLFSGPTIPVIIIQADTSWQGAGGDDYLNDGPRRSCIYHTGTAGFIFTVQDINGNPLVEGTTISASVDDGKLAGNTSETLPDMQTNRNYYLSWTNDITGDDNLIGTLTITVTSENGSAKSVLTRQLIRPVVVSVLPVNPETEDTMTVIPKGGSETVEEPPGPGGGGYTVIHPTGTGYCSYGDIFQYEAGEPGVVETVIVVDDVTGGYAEVTYTVKK